MRRQSRLVLLGVAVVAVVAGGSLLRWLFAPAAAPKLANQVWIERMHRDPRDMIHHLVLINDAQGRHFGSAGRSSHWRVHLDFLQWSHEGNRVRLSFPQDRQRLAARVRTWNCKGEAPEPFELCLELTKDRRKVRLYSRKDWVIEPGKGAEGIEPDLLAAVPGLAASLGASTTTADDGEGAPSDEVPFSEPDAFGPLLPPGEEAAPADND